MTGDALARAKRALRERQLAARIELHQQAPNAGDRLHDIFLRDIDLPPGATVAGFWSMGSEIDIRPLLTALADRGHPLALPAVAGPARPLVFRAWAPGGELVSGGFGTSVPPESAAEIRPDILLVPLLAFDRRGFRLGYGGGFYDRTIEALEATIADAIGIAFAGQEVAEVPVGIHDRRLDRIATERGIVRTTAPPGPRAN